MNLRTFYRTLLFCLALGNICWATVTDSDGTSAVPCMNGYVRVGEVLGLIRKLRMESTAEDVEKSPEMRSLKVQLIDEYFRAAGHELEVGKLMKFTTSSGESLMEVEFGGFLPNGEVSTFFPGGGKSNLHLSRKELMHLEVEEGRWSLRLKSELETPSVDPKQIYDIGKREQFVRRKAEFERLALEIRESKPSDPTEARVEVGLKKKRRWVLLEEMRDVVSEDLALSARKSALRKKIGEIEMERVVSYLDQNGTVFEAVRGMTKSLTPDQAGLIVLARRERSPFQKLRILRQQSERGQPIFTTTEARNLLGIVSRPAPTESFSTPHFSDFALRLAKTGQSPDDFLAMVTNQAPIGSGASADVFEIPNMTGYVLRKTRKLHTAEKPKVLKEELDYFPQENFGQPVATFGDLQILKRQTGLPMGAPPDNFKDPVIKRRASAFLRKRLEEAAQMPDASFERFLSQIQFLFAARVTLDTSKGNNFLIDFEAKEFRLVDVFNEGGKVPIIPKEGEPPRPGSVDLNAILSAFLSQSHTLHGTDPEVMKLRREMIYKFFRAAKKLGIPPGGDTYLSQAGITKPSRELYDEVSR